MKRILNELKIFAGEWLKVNNDITDVIFNYYATLCDPSRSTLRAEFQMHTCKKH